MLKQVFTVFKGDHATASLFFDEMANVIVMSKMHNEVLVSVL